MKFVLTIVVMLAGQSPEVVNVPADNLDQCMAMAKEFVLTQQDVMKNLGDQIAAGCNAVKIEMDRGA